MGHKEHLVILGPHQPHFHLGLHRRRGEGRRGREEGMGERGEESRGDGEGKIGRERGEGRGESRVLTTTPPQTEALGSGGKGTC